MNKSRALGILGLAFRAGKVTHGEELVLETIRANRAKCVLLADDAGPNTTKRITDKSAYYHVLLVHGFSGDELSKAIGKTNRKVVALSDENFVKMLVASISEETK